MRNWLIDIAAAVIWAGAVVLLVVNADESSGEVLIPLLIALCAGLGFTSGRFRILLVPVAITLVGVFVGLIFGDGGDCEACVDDVAPWFWIVWTAFWVGLIELAIWAGVLIRRAALGRRGQRPAA
jgi:membrane protease YdiL (CAAX protease family)